MRSRCRTRRSTLLSSRPSSYLVTPPSSGTPRSSLATFGGVTHGGAQRSRDAPAIFLVHGHDNAVKYEVARFLEDVTGRKPTILHEQASGGKTLIEKLELYGLEVDFAVVLLTPDDKGCAKNEDEARPRARQNVVFELGYFFGKLGREKVAVINANTEKPSDIDGLVYIPFDSGGWKLELVKELRAAGTAVDTSAIV